MNNEYIIVNKTALEKRIEELEFQRERELRAVRDASKVVGLPMDNYSQSYLDGKIKQLNEVLLKSTPLIPEIEKAIDSLRPYVSFNDLCEANEEYISNLKLDI